MRLALFNIILCTFFIAGNSSGATLEKYKSARKQYILEYTVFGIDECLKKNVSQLVVDQSDALEGKVLVGTSEYFSLLSRCFNEISKSCIGEKCIVNTSMAKRLENVRYVDEMKQKLLERIKTHSKKKVISKNTQKADSQKVQKK